ncbi:MAG TPA: thioredoxin [Gaiellaceae bacterium]|nr:thioredoxin [Gaiellaceae bacterium]
MLEVTDETFEEQVLRAEVPVVVDFWAPWCGPCHAITPVLEGLEQEAGDRVVFTKMNIDQYPVAASRYGVLSIPTVILFDEGEPQETVLGARPREHFVQAWARYL